MENKRFTTQHCGDVVVTKYTNHRDVRVRFVDTGTSIRTSKRALTNTDRPRLRDPKAPTVFGIGRIGIGHHKAHEGSADTQPFRIWRAMLRRCYYGPEATAWREGYTVAEVWHDFQVFADWFEENYPRDGGSYQLDKDTIALGNKVYGPAVCTFITQQENLAARRFKRDRGRPTATGTAPPSSE